MKTLKTIKDVAEQCGVPASRLYAYRHAHGDISNEELLAIFSKKSSIDGTIRKHRSEDYTWKLPDLCVQYDVLYQYVQMHIQKGMKPEEALKEEAKFDNGLIKLCRKYHVPYGWAHAYKKQHDITNNMEVIVSYNKT